MSRVFIGRLAFDARDKDVERFLRGFGRVREISIKKGYGFVEFEDSRDAEDAIDELDGKELLGERVSMQFARGQRGGGGGGGRFGGGGGRFGGGGGGGRGRFNDRSSGRFGPPIRTDHRVIVENLSSRTSWQDLKDYLRKEGRVTFADAHKQRVGEGVVEFASRDDMKNVIKRLDDTELGGKRIRIFEDDGHDKNTGGGGGRGHSRSRSRSRSRSPRRRQRSRSDSHSPVRQRSPSRSRSRSRSRTPVRERSRSHEDAD